MIANLAWTAVVRPYKYWFRWLHSMFNDVSGIFVVVLHYPFAFSYLSDHKFYWWADVIEKAILIIIIVNLIWILAHIIFSIKCCCKCCRKTELKKEEPQDLNLEDIPEPPDPAPPPPPPRIIIAPPKEIVIPSASVDANKLIHKEDNSNSSSEDSLEANIKAQNI